MSAELFRLLIDLLVVLGWGSLVLALLLLGAKLSSFLPLSPGGRARLAKGYPGAVALVALLYVLLSTSVLFGDSGNVFPIALLAALVGVASLLWPFARDVLAGVFLRAEGICELNQLVQIGTVQGRIIELGPRSISLETQAGDIAVLPYGQVSQQTIVRRSGAEQLATRRFELPLPPEVDPNVLPRALQAAALRSHWAALGRDPVVSVLPDKLEVTVYAIDGPHLIEVERAVRSEYDSRTTSGRSTRSPAPSRASGPGDHELPPHSPHPQGPPSQSSDPKTVP